jgi:acyl carrier protein
MQKREELRRFVCDMLIRKGDNEPFSDDDSLLLTGRIDSLNVLEIVTFMEKDLKFSLSAEVFDPNCYDSIDSMMELIAGSAS